MLAVDISEDARVLGLGFRVLGFRVQGFGGLAFRV